LADSSLTTPAQPVWWGIGVYTHNELGDNRSPLVYMLTLCNLEWVSNGPDIINPFFVITTYRPKTQVHLVGSSTV